MREKNKEWKKERRIRSANDKRRRKIDHLKWRVENQPNCLFKGLAGGTLATAGTGMVVKCTATKFLVAGGGLIGVGGLLVGGSIYGAYKNHKERGKIEGLIEDYNNNSLRDGGFLSASSEEAPSESESEYDDTDDEKEDN